MKYKFRGVTDAGAATSGVEEGGSPEDVARRLAARGIVALSITPSERSIVSRKYFRRSFKSDEVAAFVRELSILLSAGLKADEALSISLEAKRSAALTDALVQLRRRIRDGEPFHASVAATALLPDDAVALVRSGEVSGSLAPTLERLAVDLTKRQALRDSLVTSLLYPAVLLLTAVGALAVIVFVVAPNLQDLFEGAGAKPPAQVAALLSFVAFLRAAALPIFAALIVFGVVSAAFLRTKAGWEAWSAALLRAPLLGTWIRVREAARFSAAGALMLECGVTPTRAFPLAAGAIGNVTVRAAVQQALANAARGTSLSEALARERVLPPDLLAMIAVGLKTGRLGEVLRQASEIYAARVQARVERLTGLLTPAITIVAGFVVGGLAYLVLSAITSLNEVAYQ